MRNLTCLLCMMLAIPLLGGCSLLSNASTIREFDPASGVMVKETVTSESVASKLLESTKDKLVIYSNQSMMAYVDVSMATLDNPTPTFSMLFGRMDKVVMTMPKEMKGTVKYLSAIMESLRAGGVSVSPTSGIRAVNSGSDSEAQL